jgi:ankyrin repeat protein
VDYLIGKGASVAVVDQNGDNLAAYLVQSYNPQKADEFGAKLKVLQNKGLKIEQQQKNGNTLYHLAVAKNDLSLVKSLQPYAIDVNAKNSEGLTTLHKAAMISRDDSILKYLISIGAKKDIQTSFQETAFDLAGENEFLSKNKITINFLK